MFKLVFNLKRDNRRLKALLLMEEERTTQLKATLEESLNWINGRKALVNCRPLVQLIKKSLEEYK